MTWMPTWQHILEVRIGTCVESWVEQKAIPDSQHKSHKHICMNNQDPTLMINDCIFMVYGGSQVGTLPPCWGFASTSGTWDLGLGTPCELAYRAYYSSMAVAAPLWLMIN